MSESTVKRPRLSDEERLAAQSLSLDSATFENSDDVEALFSRKGSAGVKRLADGAEQYTELVTAAYQNDAVAKITVDKKMVNAATRFIRSAANGLVGDNGHRLSALVRTVEASKTKTHIYVKVREARPHKKSDSLEAVED